MVKQLEEQIKIIPMIIASIEKVDASAIPDGAVLLTIPQVARFTGWSERTVQERNKQGRMPEPILKGGLFQWSKAELEDWVKHDCPPRQEWVKIKNAEGGDS